MVRRGAELASEEVELTEQIEEFAKHSAHAAMLLDSRRALVPNKLGKVSLDDAAKHKRDLTARFAALALDHRRSLVRSLVRVTVYPARDEDGAPVSDRIDIEHVGAPVLDAEDQS